MTAAWAAAAMLGALRADLDRVLDDEQTGRQLIAERTAARLATVAAAFHAAAGRAGDGEDTEPYCAACGQWIGIFAGLDGWRHFRGHPVGGHRELHDPGHPAVPVWSVPPGRALSPAQARLLGQALAEETTRQLHHRGGCDVCGHGPAATGPGGSADTGRASGYGELLTALARAAQIAGEER